MSLINRMLKDLEKRQSERRLKDHSLVDLTVTDIPERNKRPYYFLGASIVALFGVLLILYFTSTMAKSTTSTQQILLPLPKPQNTSSTSSSQNNLIADSAPIALQDIYITGNLQHTDLHIDLAKQTLYNIASNANQDSLTLILNHVVLTEPLQVANTKKTIVNQVTAAPSANGDALILHLAVIPGTQVRGLAFLKDNPTQLVLSLDNPAQTILSPVPIPLANTPAVSKLQTQQPVMIKVPQPLTAAEFAGQAYQNALRLMGENRVVDAIYSLRALLVQMPNYVPARRLLINLLLQQQRFEEAYQVVKIGLRQHPDSPAFILALARIEASQGKYDKALIALQSINPPLQGNTEYYGLMAGLYERLGQPQLAINLYEQLLQLYPTNATWLLGLGVCLEAVGRNSEALMAYQKASFSHTLDPQLQGFVDYRIKILSGTIHG